MVDKVRRTQAERRADARRRLEEAAIRALVECGSAGASTTEICRRADLSQGALFQHYPSKQALLVAAMERLHLGLRDRFFDELARVPAEDRTLGALRLLWRVYATPEAVASLDLYHRSRTEPELREVLSPMLERHWAHMLASATEVFPPHVLLHPDFASLLSIAVWSIQGAAPGVVIEGVEPAVHDANLTLLARLLERR